MLEVAKLAIPSIIALMFATAAELINTIFVGHLNDPELLVGVGMGNIIIVMLCNSVFLGMNGAIETLVSQAYGSGNFKMCAVYLNRGRMILLLAFIPIILLLINTDHILVALGISAEASYYAKIYIVH